jgi:hypothetical protein
VQGTPACVTVNVCPPTVIVPVRLMLPVFAATENVTLPVSEPLAELVTVIQLAPLAAVQAQPADVVTVNEPVPPAAATDCESGESE